LSEPIPYTPAPNGYTEDRRQLEAVRAWVKAAEADGWSLRPTFPKNETAESAATLERDGFKLMTLARVHQPQDRPGLRKRAEFYAVSIHLWGPDGVAIEPPPLYDWGAVRAGLRKCPECGAEDVETFRVAFANRACGSCRPALAKALEFPGWYN
jgi:hypothetical protein